MVMRRGYNGSSARVWVGVSMELDYSLISISLGNYSLKQQRQPSSENISLYRGNLDCTL